MIRTRAVRWSVYLLVAVAFAVVCALLSHWQFDRNEQRGAANALIERNYDAEPLPVADVLDGVDGFDPQSEWQPVVLSGRYLPEDQLLVRNRPQNGSVGFEVLVPFRLDDGRVIVVDRGWLPQGEGDGPDAVPAPPQGQVTVTARLRPGESLPSSGRGAPDGQLPTIHLPSVAALTGESTVTGAYGVIAAEEPAPAERPHAVAAPEIDPGPHLSYAIQWILFAAMGFVFIGYMIRTEVRARREDEEEEEEEEEDDDEDGVLPAETVRRRPARAQRPRDRDAIEEDALLDAER